MTSHSPTTSLDRMTVNAGAVLLTVSVKLTSMYLRATSPRKTVVNLFGKKMRRKLNSSKNISFTFVLKMNNTVSVSATLLLPRPPRHHSGLGLRHNGLGISYKVSDSDFDRKPCLGMSHMWLIPRFSSSLMKVSYKSLSVHIYLNVPTMTMFRTKSGGLDFRSTEVWNKIVNNEVKWTLT